jgi:hypothetical protein
MLARERSMGPEEIETARDPRTDFIERWAYGTVFAWFLGAISAIVMFLAYTEILSRLFPDSPQQTHDALALIGGTIFLVLGGAIVGEAQWRIGLQGKVRKQYWMLANATIPFTFIFCTLMLRDLILPPIYGSTNSAAYYVAYQKAEPWLAGVLVQGIVWGLALGLPTWFVLRITYKRASRWLIANVSAVICVLLIDTALMAGSHDDVLPRLLGCCYGPIILGEATGIVLYSVFNTHEKNPAGDHFPHNQSTGISKPP